MTVINDVIDERMHQDERWGGPEHDDAHRTLDFVRFVDDFTIKARNAVLNGDVGQARRRFVQVAALAVAAAESLDRRGHC